VAVGVLGGLLQGTAIARLKVPPFIVTLGGLTAFRGGALLFSSGQPISTFTDEYKFWGQGMVGPVPVPVIIFLGFALLAYVVLRYARYGRHLYAVGGNPEAARLSGLNVSRIVLSVYVITGLLCRAFWLSALFPAQLGGTGGRGRLRVDCDRRCRDRWDQPVRRRRWDFWDGDRYFVDRCAQQWA
jgi:ribose/xylose/arabinose/galactoside ABC-type transport system permease subunit